LEIVVLFEIFKIASAPCGRRSASARQRSGRPDRVMGSELPPFTARGKIPRRPRRREGQPPAGAAFCYTDLILTGATVWRGRVWFRRHETLVFATGDRSGPETGFADKLATVIRNNNLRLHPKVVPNAEAATTLAQSDRSQADRAMLRTDAKAC
jgi:hypothetical protein